MRFDFQLLSKKNNKKNVEENSFFRSFLRFPLKKSNVFLPRCDTKGEGILREAKKKNPPPLEHHQT